MLIAIAVVSLLTGGVAGACLASTAIRACMRNGTYRWCDVKGSFVRVQRPPHKATIQFDVDTRRAERQLKQLRTQLDELARQQGIEELWAQCGLVSEDDSRPHAARETPMKTGSANADVAHDDAEVP